MCKNLEEDVDHLLRHSRSHTTLHGIMLNEFDIQLDMPAAVKVKYSYLARDLEGIKEEGLRSSPFSTHVTNRGKVIGVLLKGWKTLLHELGGHSISFFGCNHEIVDSICKLRSKTPILLLRFFTLCTSLV